MTWPAAGATPAAHYDAWFDGPWGRHAWRVETAAVLAALGPLAARRVADIGCGTGRLLGSLTRHGAQAVGVDGDPAMLALAATRARSPAPTRTSSPWPARAWTPPSPWPPWSSPPTRPGS